MGYSRTLFSNTSYALSSSILSRSASHSSAYSRALPVNIAFSAVSLYTAGNLYFSPCASSRLSLSIHASTASYNSSSRLIGSGCIRRRDCSTRPSPLTSVNQRYSTPYAFMPSPGCTILILSYASPSALSIKTLYRSFDNSFHCCGSSLVSWSITVVRSLSRSIFVMKNFITKIDLDKDLTTVIDQETSEEPQQWNELSKDLYKVLIDKAEGEAYDKIKMVQSGDGMRAPM